MLLLPLLEAWSPRPVPADFGGGLFLRRVTTYPSEKVSCNLFAHGCIHSNSISFHVMLIPPGETLLLRTIPARSRHSPLQYNHLVVRNKVLQSVRAQVHPFSAHFGCLTNKVVHRNKVLKSFAQRCVHYRSMSFYVLLPSSRHFIATEQFSDCFGCLTLGRHITYYPVTKF
jgi:hypothetical protein